MLRQDLAPIFCERIVPCDFVRIRVIWINGNRKSVKRVSKKDPAEKRKREKERYPLRQCEVTFSPINSNAERKREEEARIERGRQK